MDPYIKDILEKIKQENSEAYESGDFQTLFDSYNKRAPFKVASVATLQGFYNELDSLQVEDEKKKSSQQRTDRQLDFRRGFTIRIFRRTITFSINIRKA